MDAYTFGAPSRTTSPLGYELPLDDSQDMMDQMAIEEVRDMILEVSLEQEHNLNELVAECSSEGGTQEPLVLVLIYLTTI